jgi:hypothetical protein
VCCMIASSLLIPCMANSPHAVGLVRPEISEDGTSLRKQGHLPMVAMTIGQADEDVRGRTVVSSRISGVPKVRGER